MKLLRKAIGVFGVLFFALGTVQVYTYPHIVLKGLFDVLKKDDIGFAHALLHSKWIENMYQYGPGKPYREVERASGRQWSFETEDDAVANIVRRFWFRRDEGHALLPTRVGCLANIPGDQLGIIFGKIINWLYEGLDPNVETALIDDIFMFDSKARQVNQELKELKEKIADQKNILDKKFYLIKEAERILDVKKQELIQRFKKEEKFDKERYLQSLQEARKQVFSGIDKEFCDSYQNALVDLKQLKTKEKKLIKQKRGAIQKTLFTPIRKAWKLCKTAKRYLPRTIEAILWALFLHKTDDLASLQEKINAVNDCLFQIDEKFKNKGFKDTVLKEFFTGEQYAKFEEKIKNQKAQEQIKMIFAQYDLALHFLIYLKEGDFPPIVSQGNYGYEYESGKISIKKPNCYETAMHDLVSILWYNPVTKKYDNSLFSVRVIAQGKGLKRFAQALKYFYLADKKGIKPQEYMMDKKFTSLAKLKSLKKITPEEVESLDISQVPSSYIDCSVIKQELFNIVSNLPDIVYDSRVQDMGYELKPGVGNFIKLLRYFYGIDIENLEQASDKMTGISTDKRKIIFTLEGEGDAPNTIRIIVNDYKNKIYFGIIITIQKNHVTLSVPAREKSTSHILRKDVAAKILRKIVALSGLSETAKKLLKMMEHEIRGISSGKIESKEEFAKILKKISTLPIQEEIEASEGKDEDVDGKKERLISVFTLLTYERLLDSSGIHWRLPMLNLIYYSLLLKRAEVKFRVLRDIFLRHTCYYPEVQFFVHNLIESLPENYQCLHRELASYIILSKKYQIDPGLKNYIIKYKELFFVDLAKTGERALIETLLKQDYRSAKEKNLFITQALPLAVANGHKETVELLLEQLSGKLQIDLHNDLFIVAAENGRMEIVESLLVKPDITKKSVRQALVEAAGGGYKKMVKLLLKSKKMDITYRNKTINMALPWAATKGRQNIVMFLLSKKVIEPKYLGVALIKAAYHKHKKIVEILLAQSGIEKKDVGDALVAALQKGYKEIAEYLLENSPAGVDVTVQDENKNTPLLLAVTKGYTAIVKELLDKYSSEIDINWQNRDKNTALIIAAGRGYEKIVELLLQTFSDTISINLESIYGGTALIVASAGRYTKIVDMLLEKSDMRDQDIKKLFINAAGNDDKGLLELILEKFPKLLYVNIRDNFRITPLIQAASSGCKEVVTFLLAQPDIQVNLKDMLGNTALIRAARSGHKDIVQLLLGHEKIDPKAKNVREETAADVAQDNKHLEIAKIIREYIKNKGK